MTALALRVPLWAGVLATLLFVDLASAARHLTGTLKPVLNEAREFDYFMFVRQWPGNYCGTHACPLLKDAGPFHFTIHGLWPNYNDGTWPQFCDSSYKFDEDEVADLEGAMDLEWPSFMGEDETFWEHEWSKHGTCALDVMPSEHKYFKTVLKLHWKYDLAAALRKANIVPRKDEVYRNQDLVDAIDHMYGVRPIVHCFGKALSEIWMCLDKDLQPFDCDTSHEKNNCAELTIPPLKTSGKKTSEAGEDVPEWRGQWPQEEAEAAAGEDDFDVLQQQLRAVREAREAQQDSMVAAVTAAIGAVIAPDAEEEQQTANDYISVGVQAAQQARGEGDEAANEEEVGSVFTELASLAASRMQAAAQLLPLLLAADSAGDLTGSGDGADGGGVESASAADSVYGALLLGPKLLRGAASAAATGEVEEAEEAAGEGDGDASVAEDDEYLQGNMYVDWLPFTDVISGRAEAVAEEGAGSAAAAAGAAGRFQQEQPADGGAEQALWDEWQQQQVQQAQVAAAQLQAARQVAWSVLGMMAEVAQRASAAVQQLRASGAVPGRDLDDVGGGGFVWTSKLRAAEQASDAEAEDADGSGDDGSVVSVVADGDGHVTWTVRRVVVLHGGAAGEGAGADGLRAADWLVIAQLACVAVIAVSLAVLAGMALAGAVQPQQPQQQAEALRQQASRRSGSGVAAVAEAGLAEPLLLLPGEELAAGKGRMWGPAGAAARREEEEEEEVDELATLRTGIVVVLPMQRQEQGAAQQCYAPVH